MNGFELGILDFIQNNLRCPFADVVLRFITSLGHHGIFFMIFAAVLLIFKKTRKAGLTMAFALSIGYITGNLIIKNVVGRVRPYELNTAIELIARKPHDSSFPSGHTLAATEWAVSIFLYNKKWGTAAIITAALIGFSRLYLYMHFPTDVLAGAALGVLATLAAKFITDKIYGAEKPRKV